MAQKSKSQNSKDILSIGIFGAIAVALTFGAAQFALGGDLASIELSGSGQMTAGSSQSDINRTAKSDRVASASGPVAPTRTISLRLNDLVETSVLVRIPVASDEARSLTNAPNRKSPVACEPVVSVLTEVAKQLQPGRCVT